MEEANIPSVVVGTEDAECPICLEALPKIRTATRAATPDAANDDDDSDDAYNILDIAQLQRCCHTFHQSCLNQHDELSHNRRCPNCRENIVMINPETGDEEIMAWTANRGGMIMPIDLMTFFQSDRFYRDNQDIAKAEAIAAGEDVELITDLIKEGVDVNSSYEDGNSGLMMATMNGRLNVVRCFLEHGVNVNAVSLFGSTALDQVDDATCNNEELRTLLETSGGLHRGDVCGNCGKTTRESNHTPPSSKMKRCSRCKKMHYCNGICQKNHWSKHKVWCVQSSKS